MRERKATRYIADCGKGFWDKGSCLSHEENCKCWTNPKNKACKTCVFGCFNGSCSETGAESYWDCNCPKMTKDEHSGAPKGIEYISVNCPDWDQLKALQP